MILISLLNTAYLLAVVGYDGVDEFFPALLELIQSKIYGADVPSVLSETTADASLQSNDNVKTGHAVHCTELKPLFASTDADSIVASLDQSSSATARYYFSAGLCSKCVKPLPSRGQLERRQLDGQAALEHVVAVNGFTEH